MLERRQHHYKKTRKVFMIRLLAADHTPQDVPTVAIADVLFVCMII